MLFVFGFATINIWANTNTKKNEDSAVSEKGLQVAELDNVQKDNFLKDYGTIEICRIIKTNQGEFELYPEFTNNKEAMKNLIEKEEKALQYLEARYGFEQLNDSNYQEYRGCVMGSLEQVDVPENIATVLPQIDEFLDIYENEVKNDQIETIVNNLSKSINNGEFIKLKEEVELSGDVLPYNLTVSCTEEDAEPVKVVSVSIKSETGIETKSKAQAHPGNSKFDIEKGIAYAKQYAPKGKHNSKYYYFNGGDCTNFVSQIKKTGGVPFHYTYKGTVNPTLDKKNSWYYKSKSDYGYRWTVADKFAKFYGVKYKTTSFMSLSKNVKRGSFITKDSANDKDWDHMGFVTEITENKKTTEGSTYYDFKVAQHTADYHAYVSSKKCGWDKIKKEHPKAVFGIVK